MNVVIVGAGAIGHAIRSLITYADVSFWDKQPNKVENQLSLKDLVPEANVLFFCIPSWALTEATTEVRPYLSNSTIIVGISKGLQLNGQLTSQYLSEQLDTNVCVILSGPMLAKEIEEGKHAFAQVAGTESQALKAVAGLFKSSRLHITTSHDPDSVALAGVLKNIYAIAFGIADGLHVGNNVKGKVVETALNEMQQIAQYTLLDETLILSTSGVADLIATGFSENSSNHRVGYELATLGKTEISSEGLVSLPILLEQLKDKANTLSLLNLIQQVAMHSKNASAVLEQLLTVI